MFQSTPDLVNRENVKCFNFHFKYLLFQSTPDLVNRENNISQATAVRFPGFNPLPI